MTDYRNNLVSEVFIGETIRPGPDGELVLGPRDVASISVPGGESHERSRWYGRILFGPSYQQMTDLIAGAGERRAVSGSRRADALMTKAVRHARLALRHAALARAAILTTILFCMLVAVVVLAHETRNTVSIYESYLGNPGIARAPQQSWGYTPVLHDLPEGVKANLIALDRFVEARFKTLGLGQSKSGSSSVHSLKLGAAIMSLFGLIPVVQFGLGQAGKARLRRTKAVRAMACGCAA